MRRDLSLVPRAILFDWDNTLVDTWGVIHESMNVTLRYMGRDQWTIEETKKNVRKALREAFPDLFGDRWEEARDVFYKRFHAIHLERLEIKTGASDLLEFLVKKQIFLGVVSNKSGCSLRSEVNYLGWSRYFRSLVGASDAARDKPARDPVDLALRSSEVNAGREVWFVGDTDVDIQCAHTSGCVPILISELSSEERGPKDSRPEMTFTNLEGFMALVSRRL